MALSKEEKLVRKAANDLARYEVVLERTKQAREYYHKLNKQTVFVAQTTSKVLETQEKEFPIMDIGTTQLLHPSQEATPLQSNQEYAPDPTTIVMKSNLYRARVRITRELLESNLSKKGITPIIRKATNEKLAQEIEDIHLLGVGPTGGVGYANPITSSMRMEEGWIERARAVNVYDCNGTQMTEKRAMEMLALLPSEHYSPKTKHFMNHRAWLALRSDLQSRGTDLGDKMVGATGDLNPRFGVGGMMIDRISRLPDQWGTQAADKTISFMCDPKKAWLGYFRRPDFKMFTDPMTDVMFLVITMRMGNQWIDTDGFVFGENVGLLPTSGA
jgi:hypothetical protein